MVTEPQELVTGEHLSSELADWSGSRPNLTNDIEADTRAVGAFVRAGEALFSVLPGRPNRTSAEQGVAGHILKSIRAVRAHFLQQHVAALYDVLTAARTRYVRLPDLLVAASERYPGLVPSSAQLRAERALLLAQQDGIEIDLGVFTRAVLLCPQAGAHLIDAMLRPTDRAQELLATFRSNQRIDLGSVLVERRGATAYVTMQNLHCLNAEDVRLVADLETAVDLVLLDDSVLVGVIRGGVMTHPKYIGKRVFCAGINLRALKDGQIPLVDFLLVRELGLLNKLRCGLLHSDEAIAGTGCKPWVGAVDSFAIGGGMQLLLVLDHVIAANDAFFSLPATHEGIVPGAANLRIGRYMGGRLSRQLIYSGLRIAATDPAAPLVCDDVVGPEEMDAAIERAAHLLDTPAVAANRRMLNLAEEPADSFRSYMAEFAVVQAMRLHGDDVIARMVDTWRGARA